MVVSRQYGLVASGQWPEVEAIGLVVGSRFRWFGSWWLDGDGGLLERTADVCLSYSLQSQAYSLFSGGKTLIGYLRDRFRVAGLKVRYERMVQERLLNLVESSGPEAVAEDPGRWTMLG